MSSIERRPIRATFFALVLATMLIAGLMGPTAHAVGPAGCAVAGTSTSQSKSCSFTSKTGIVEIIAAGDFWEVLTQFGYTCAIDQVGEEAVVCAVGKGDKVTAYAFLAFVSVRDVTIP